jgi:hypothetical protein
VAGGGSGEEAEKEIDDATEMIAGVKAMLLMVDKLEETEDSK